MIDFGKAFTSGISDLGNGLSQGFSAMMNGGVSPDAQASRGPAFNPDLWAQFNGYHVPDPGSRPGMVKPQDEPYDPTNPQYWADLKRYYYDPNQVTGKEQGASNNFFGIDPARSAQLVGATRPVAAPRAPEPPKPPPMSGLWTGGNGWSNGQPDEGMGRHFSVSTDGANYRTSNVENPNKRWQGWQAPTQPGGSIWNTTGK